MGLGLIALGFVLLEGMTMNINAMKLLPEYISLTIFLIGILVIKKKAKIKYFDYALIFGIIQFIHHFVFPKFESHFSFALTTVFLIMEIVVRLSFYAMVFKGIDEIVKNNRTRLYMKIFWIIYVLLSAYLLIIYFQANAQYPQNNIEAPQTVLSGILLWSKVLLCDMISYRLYKHNKELVDEYEDLSAELVKSYPSYLYILLMIVSFVLLVAIQKPVFYALEDAAKRSFAWYGSVEDKIIIEGWVIEEETHFIGVERKANAPIIWVNESDYEKSEYCTIIEYVGNSETIVEDKTLINKELEVNPDTSYYLGKVAGYKYLSHDNLYGFKDDVYDMRNSISIKVVLYDHDMNIVDEYNVPLIDRQPRLTEYHYQDSDIKIERFMVDGDFIIQMPRITFKDENLKKYQIYISNSPTFGEYSINSINNQVIQDEIKERFGEYFYEEENAHIYLKAKQNYYIHIGYFENDIPHIIKTVRLEK